MPTEADFSSPEAQSFFNDAITSARLRVAFAESILASAQRELESARESLLRLETRREQLGLPDVANEDDLSDDVSLLSDDHAHSVGSRSTMYIGSVGGITDEKNGGFSLKNSIKSLRGKGGNKNNISNDSRSVSSAPAVVKRNNGKKYVALMSPPKVTDEEVSSSPTKRSITPEPEEQPENDNSDNTEKEETTAKKLFPASPSRTVSTAPTAQSPDISIDTRSVSSAPTMSTRENNEDAMSRASARSAALEKEDEAETLEYTIFKQTLRDHYNSLQKESKTEEAVEVKDVSMKNFEPIQMDMVTMDTIIEEPIDPEEGVSLVKVANCGIDQINGSYLKFDSRDGVPTYSKIDNFESFETMFTIARWAATNGNRKWYITAIVPGQSPPVKSVFYVAYSSSNIPPKEGWMVVDEGSDLFLTPEYTERGVQGAPKLDWEIDDGVASVANTHISKQSSVSNSHYYEIGQQVLNGLTREK